MAALYNKVIKCSQNKLVFVIYFLHLCYAGLLRCNIQKIHLWSLQCFLSPGHKPVVLIKAGTNNSYHTYSVIWFRSPDFGLIVKVICGQDI